MQATIDVDKRVFDKVFAKYMQYTKRSLVESCNTHAYYIARDCVATTKGTEKEKIERDLMKESRKYPGAPIAAILINKQLGNEGKKGLRGPAMELAVRRLIRVRIGHRNFLKSGYIPGIKTLEPLVPKKKALPPIPPGLRKRSDPRLGGARPAKDQAGSWSPIATIWNAVQGSAKGASPRVRQLLEEGAARAIRMETQSMRDYIARKQVELNQLWR